jgi:peptidoglycan/LPS O-acetylase OafA/YrhL
VHSDVPPVRTAPARGDHPTQTATGSTRLHELDLLKAAGIVAVVLIHSMRGPFESGASAFELLLGEATRFAVPAFLFATGALAASPGRAAGTPANELRSRLSRLLLPYLVATVAAELFRAARGLGPSTGSVWLDLFTGAAFGPYYYVFVAVPLVFLARLARRWSEHALWTVTLLLLVLQGGAEMLLFELPLFWHLRNPALWWAYWFAGACYGRHRDRIVARLGAGRGAWFVGAAGAAVAATALAVWFHAPPQELGYRLATWLALWATLLALLALGLRARSVARSRPVRLLSEATYTIYLWQLFAVYPLRDAAPAAPEVFEPWRIALPWTGGLLLPLLLVSVARKFLGPATARRWLGA